MLAGRRGSGPKAVRCVTNITLTPPKNEHDREIVRYRRDALGAGRSDPRRTESGLRDFRIDDSQASGKLRDRGYVHKVDGVYQLGFRFLELGEHVRNRRNAYQLAKEPVETLTEESGEHAQFVVE